MKTSRIPEQNPKIENTFGDSSIKMTITTYLCQLPNGQWVMPVKPN